MPHGPPNYRPRGFTTSCLLLNLAFLTLLPGGLLVKAQLASNSLQNSPISYLDAIAGGAVLLPCDVTPPNYGDTFILVLFYRGENKTPIYSVDSRGSSLRQGIHWSAKYLEGRSHMRTTPRGSGLYLEDVRLKDAGLYRCRIDFEASPTRNSRVQLRVIEPPRRINVVSTWEGERRTSDIIGPYPEGAEVTISCQVIGGTPPPKVTWWQEGSLLDDISEVNSGGVTRNTLHLPKLNRGDLLKVITCQAINSNLTSPLTKAVTIDLAFPPSRIRITSTRDLEEDADLSAMSKEPMLVTCITGEKCPLECKVDGSRPPPLVTWKSNGRTLETEFQTITSPPGAKGTGTSEDSSFYSTLMLTADVNDNGALISCRATSPALPQQAIEDNVRLNVLYKPRLKLHVKDRIDLTNVEEGEDIEFECRVNANPLVVEIQWTRNWIPLVHNSSAGVHVVSSGSFLMLKNVTQRLSGRYACAAANSRGSGTSNVVELSIKFAPKCSSKQMTSVGVGRAESANITCRVDAHPTATIFRWAFNTSTELVDIPFDQQIEKNDSSNTIMYQPRTPFDFGDLLCWASNSVGTMREPCVIKILPIDKPESVRGCKISTNGTLPDEMVTIICLPGWNGGLSQKFALEVRKAAHIHARELYVLKHSEDPVFYLRNLDPGEEYLLTITSANPRGTSPPVTLTYKSPEEVIAGLTNKHSNPRSSFMKFLPFLAIFVAIVVVMTTCVSIIACIARSRAAEKAQNKREMDRKASMESRKTSIQHSLPPDRGKEEIDDDDMIVKEASDHYCAVHGHERRENEYISYKHYFNNMRDDMETQHLLKSSLGGSSGTENQLNSFNNGSRESSSSYGIERQPTKDSIMDYTGGRSINQRYSDGSFRGLAPLASVDSLSGYSTLSNHSSASKKTENSSQKSFRAIPETDQKETYSKPSNGFLPRSLNSNLPSIKVTAFPPMLEQCAPASGLPSDASTHTPGFETMPSNNKHFKKSPNYIYSSSVTPSPHPSCSYPNYSSPPSTHYSTLSGDGRGYRPTSTPSNSAYTTPVIPSLPPPIISTHPMFHNEGFKPGQFYREENHQMPTPGEHQERKLSRESSV